MKKRRQKQRDQMLNTRRLTWMLNNRRLTWAQDRSFSLVNSSRCHPSLLQP
jgi:hypothetical protein